MLYDCCMAYDEDLARRIRALMSEMDGVTERKMFGGLAFLVNGNMAIAASSQGGLLVRVDPTQTDESLSLPSVQPMEMRGRTMRGWLRVSADAVTTDPELSAWVTRSTTYVLTLPSKL